MFANKLRLILREGNQERQVPKVWLDQFFMRYFTGYSAFDETLPVADGELETGWSVDPEDVRDHFERWLRGRKMISPDSRLLVIRGQSIP
jgi:hypothetical protein